MIQGNEREERGREREREREREEREREEKERGKSQIEWCQKTTREKNATTSYADECLPGWGERGFISSQKRNLWLERKKHSPSRENKRHEKESTSLFFFWGQTEFALLRQNDRSPPGEINSPVDSFAFFSPDWHKKTSSLLPLLGEERRVKLI